MTGESTEGNNRYYVTVTCTIELEEIWMLDRKRSGERHLHHATASKYTEIHYRGTEQPVPHSSGAR